MIKIDRPRCAVGAIGMSAEAGIVWASIAAARFRDLDDYSYLAVPAEQCRLQVVAVLVCGFAIDLAFQNLLQFLECLLIDERLIVLGVLRAYVAAQCEGELAEIIGSENLKPEETARFVEVAFRHGALRTTGTSITKVLPPVSRFSKDKNHSAKKQRVIQLLGEFFERFLGLRTGSDN